MTSSTARANTLIQIAAIDDGLIGRARAGMDTPVTAVRFTATGKQAILSFGDGTEERLPAGGQVMVTAQGAPSSPRQRAVTVIFDSPGDGQRVAYTVPAGEYAAGMTEAQAAAADKSGGFYVAEAPRAAAPSASDLPSDEKIARRRAQKLAAQARYLAKKSAAKQAAAGEPEAAPAPASEPTAAEAVAILAEGQADGMKAAAAKPARTSPQSAAAKRAAAKPAAAKPARSLTAVK